MIVETIEQREVTASKVLLAANAIPRPVFADDIADSLYPDVPTGESLRTVWRLIDENRLFLGEYGEIVTKHGQE